MYYLEKRQHDLKFDGEVAKLWLDGGFLLCDKLYLYFEFPKVETISYGKNNNCHIHIPDLLGECFLDYVDLDFKDVISLDLFLIKILKNELNLTDRFQNSNNNLVLEVANGDCYLYLNISSSKQLVNYITFTEILESSLKYFQREFHKILLSMASENEYVLKLMNEFELINFDVDEFRKIKPKKIEDCDLNFSDYGYTIKLMLDKNYGIKEPLYLFFVIPKKKSFDGCNECSIHIPQLYNGNFYFDDYDLYNLTEFDYFMTKVVKDKFKSHHKIMDNNYTFCMFTNDGICTLCLLNGDEEISFKVTIETLKEFQKEYHKTILEMANENPKVKKKLKERLNRF